MNKTNCISDIIFLPRKFRTNKNSSIYSLLKKSGYFELHDKISEADIHEVLTQNKECIEDWLMFSEDKRCSSGWYFTQNEDKYFVGYYPPRDDLQKVTYNNKLDACAAFVKREIEEIRNIK